MGEKELLSVLMGKLDGINVNLDNIKKTREEDVERTEKMYQQLRDMHKSHFDNEKTLSNSTIQITERVDGIKGELRAHKDGHWRWFGAITGIIAAIEFVRRIAH